MSSLRPLRSGQGAGSSDEARVDMAPLIDVVFLLLIFYVVAATFVQPTAVPIHRPSVSQSTPLPERPVIITIAADGSAWLGDDPWRASDAAALRLAFLDRQHQRVLIHSDAQVPTGRLVEIIDACRSAGASSVDIAADQDVR